MKNKLLYSMIFIFLNSCSNSCDKLEFDDSFENVELNLIKIENTVRNYDKYNKSFTTIKFSDHTILWKDNEKDSGYVTIEKVIADSLLTQQITNASRFLKKNNIHYVYKDHETGLYMFGYCENETSNGSLWRAIVIDNFYYNSLIKCRYNVIYKRSRLILISAKD